MATHSSVLAWSVLGTGEHWDWATITALPLGIHCSQNFLSRKAMTNLDSVLKSRDITLPTKVRIVKAMVFPVVMYGYESWTVKKAEH